MSFQSSKTNSSDDMHAFLPSEISRLTYGYLRTHCDENLADEFSKSCPSMNECRQMKHNGRNFHSTVQDLTLEKILDQYSLLCSTIFQYFDEDKREHRNVLNLLEIILKKQLANARVFQDVQNIPNRIAESQTTRGRENKLQGMSDKSTKMSSKKKTAPSFPVPAVTKKAPSNVDAKVSLVRNVSKNIDLDYSSMDENQDDAEMNNTQNVRIIHLPPQSILHSSQLELVKQSFDSSLTNVPGKTVPISKEVETDRRNTKSVSAEPVPAKTGQVDFDDSNYSPRLKLALETPSTCEETSIKENEKPESCEGINSQEMLTPSTEIVPSSHASTSVRADWKSIFCKSFKIPTPLKGTSQKVPSESSISSSKTTQPAKEAVPPQECIQVFFENLSKGFKHRPHPYLSPAKSKGLYQAALSPLSKMYVTPTKPNIPNAAALNGSVASNATSTSSIASQRSIFSPVSVDSPMRKTVPEKPKQNERSSKRVSSTEKRSDKRKKCQQKPQLSYDVNDEIVKKVNTISNTSLDSRSIKNMRRAGHKSTQQVSMQNSNSVDGGNSKISKSKDPRHLCVSSDQKRISSLKNEENRKYELKADKKNTEEIFPKSIEAFNIEDMFRVMVLRVFVEATGEIAELDISTEHMLYHRNSTLSDADSTDDSE